MTTECPAELAVIGPILTGDDYALTQLDELSRIGFGSSAFESLRCKSVWEEACRLVEESAFTREKLLTFINESPLFGSVIEEKSVWISEVANSGMSLQMVENATFVLDRKLKREAENMVEIAKKSDKGEDMVSKIESDMASLRIRFNQRSTEEKDIACEELSKELEAMLHGGSTLQPSTVEPWDKILGGLPRSQVIVVAGRPGAGKTSLLEQMIDGLVRSNIGVLYIQRELSRTRAIGRLACRNAKLAWSKIELRKANTFEIQALQREVNAYKKLPLFLEPIRQCNGASVAATIRYHVRHNDVRLVVLDHLQLIDCPRGVEMRHAIGDLTRSLKLVANETSVTVIAISQLSRQSEKAGEAPRKSDLNESGRIEQDADVILGLWNKDRDDHSRWVVNWSILKNRNGAEGKVEAMFDGPTMSFLGLVTSQT